RQLRINTNGSENNINLHFETNVKDKSLLLKLETLTRTHLKIQIHPFQSAIFLTLSFIVLRIIG
ncbi:MAG TPA: hypothetical protein VL854_02040, partial [Nitrososphaeraceae archaeon]|nr:hypothetical protein [Nitrososphaeraceae archaeon]